ncbi:hypothetical protein C8R44DRAFT_986766, partial [Mycena epipterygia]
MKKESTPDQLQDPLVAAAHALAEAQRQVAAATAAPSRALAESEKRCKALQAELAELRDDRLREQMRAAAAAERLTAEVNELRSEKTVLLSSLEEATKQVRERDAERAVFQASLESLQQREKVFNSARANMMEGLKELQRDRATFNTEKQAAQKSQQAAQDKLKTDQKRLRSDQLKLAADQRSAVANWKRTLSALQDQITYHDHPADEEEAPIAVTPTASSSSGPAGGRTDGTSAQPLKTKQGPPPPPCSPFDSIRRRTEGTGARRPPAPLQGRIAKRVRVEFDSPEITDFEEVSKWELADPYVEESS